jgi:iron complex outermembrane receptor protein
VEIIKGPAAVLWGQGGFGAVVNRITKRPLMNPRTEIRIGMGSFDTYQAALDDTRPLPVGNGRQLAYRLSATWRDGSVYRGTPIKNVEIAPSLLWQPTKYTRIMASYIYSLNQRRGGWAMPMRNGNPQGMYSLDGAWHSYGNYDLNHTVDGDVRRLERNVTSVDIQQVFSKHIQFRGQVQYEKRDRNDYEVQPEISYLTILEDAIIAPRRYRELFRHDNNYRVRAELVGQFHTGPVSHRLLGGFHWDRLDYDEDQWYTPTNRAGTAATGTREKPGVTLAQYMANPAVANYSVTGNNGAPAVVGGNIFDPQNSPLMPDRSLLRPGMARQNNRYRNFQVDNTEFYTMEVMGFFNDYVLLQGGVRHTDTKRNITLRRTGVSTVISPKATTYSVGGVWHIDSAKRYTLYANMNSSFEPNFQLDKIGDPLDPTTGDQKEVGLKFDLAQGRFQGLVCWYNIKQNNVPRRRDDDGTWYTINELQSDGMEAALNFRPLKGWYVMGSYAYTDAKNNETGRPVPLQARNVFSVLNTYTIGSGLLKGLKPSLSISYRSSRPSEYTPDAARSEPEWTLPECWVVNAGLSYTFRFSNRTRMTVSLQVKNLFNELENYFVAFSDRFTPEAGRQITFATTLRF